MMKMILLIRRGVVKMIFENNNWNGTKDEEEDGKRIEVEMK